MNRTATCLLIGLFCLSVPVGATAAQDPEGAAEPRAQGPVISEIVEQLRKQEEAATRVRLELRTEGHLPGGLEFSTRGQVRVLRAEHGGVIAVQSSVDYTFADGLTGRMESVKTTAGVQILEQNPTFGEIHVRLDPELVGDLEWAGEVLQRSDLPGVADTRATAPLGSAMIADLAQRYELAPMSRKDRGGQPGIWYGGDRRPGPGLDGEDPDVPLADHVELFVRAGDHALLEVVYLQLGQVVQRISVDELAIGEAMAVDSFRIKDADKEPRDVRDHAPMWQQIEQVLDRAKEKAGGELPPSRRK